MNINKIAKAIEADAGVELPELKQSLREMHAGEKGRVYTKEQLLVREVRTLVGYTQPHFARVIKASLTSLRDWEQGRHEPPGVVSTLMSVIKNHPDIIQELEAK
jgi:putative transcriptional regulator